MPTAVTDYLCIASQYTNGNGIGPYGVNAVATLRGGGAVTSNDTKMGPTSLGNFGGYITYYYKDAITDNPNNPYGVDFTVIGNSYDGSGSFAEPGNVLVSEDGKTWYTLAGSVHYDDNAIWNYEVTYENKSGVAAWKDNEGQEGTMYTYPRKERYPLFPWTPELEQKITLTGVLLAPQQAQNEYGNTLPPFSEFGYADVGDPNGSSNDPYIGLDETGTYKRQQDGFDLKWAVDASGLPIDLSNAKIHYVKVQTASFIDNGAIGEKSTEVNGMYAADPSPSAVDVTDAPTSIAVDGKAVSVPGANLGVVNNVEVSGAFVVNVGTSAGNVYIRNVKNCNPKILRSS